MKKEVISGAGERTYSPDSGTAPIHLVRLCGNNEGRSDAAFRHNRERRKSAGVASLYAKANKYHR